MSGKQLDFSRAADFIWRSARLIDRSRFAYLFLNGDREAVLAALRAYQNVDGGFGNALEPDIRAPISQPVPVWSALEMLDQIDGFTDLMVKRACDYLLTITTSDGGVPFVLPSVRASPRAPWWNTEDNPPGSLLPTAGIAGLLYKHKVNHPWLVKATEFCWRKIEALEQTNAYEVRFVLPFVDHAPDRVRAERAFARIGPQIFAQHLVTLDPNAPGEVHTPLNFAPRPDCWARELFSDEVLDAHLDALVARQQADGGWMFNWKDWNPATTLEWRGWLTVETLLVLRAYGRLP